MNSSAKLAVISPFLILGAGGCGKPAPPFLDVVNLKSPPAGHYLVNLESGGTERMATIRIDHDSARCINSNDPRLRGLMGKFEPIGNGVFRIVLRNKDYTASQWWLFKPDGAAVVKEVPDRGEQERAVPVPDESPGHTGVPGESD